MAEVIIMPKLGFNMDEGTLVQWNVELGQRVKKGDPLFEMETDKTSIPVEATMDGVLLKTLIEVGSKVAVFTPIAVMGEEGEDPSAALAAFKSIADAPAQEDAPSVSTSQASQEASAAENSALRGKLSPRARKYVQENGIPLPQLADIQGSGYEGGITEQDVKASPLAKKLAAKENINLANVEGSGAGGKIMAVDVRSVTSSPDSQDKQILEEIPYVGVRKIVGDRLSQSKFTAPHLYFTEAIDVGNLLDFRKQINKSADEKVGVNDLLVMAASKALQKYPQMNASLLKDKILLYENVNVGLAVAGDKGLIVPVIKNCQQKSLAAIARESKDYVQRGRSGQLLPHEYSGGTFTISNLGMFGIENFTAIINPPESAILAVSSTRKKPVVVEGEDGDSIAIRPIMNVQLSVDHRIIDGLLAVQFLGYFRELLEAPMKIVL